MLSIFGLLLLLVGAGATLTAPPMYTYITVKLLKQDTEDWMMAVLVYVSLCIFQMIVGTGIGAAGWYFYQ